jgi:hypothetical protein
MPRNNSNENPDDSETMNVCPICGHKVEDGVSHPEGEAHDECTEHDGTNPLPDGGYSSWEMTKTGHDIDYLVDVVEDLGDDPECQYYYATYSDVFHTTPRCPHLEGSENLHVTGLRSNLNGPLKAGANRVAGPTDEHCDLRECSWCEEHSGYHNLEHPNRERRDSEDGEDGE